MESKEATCTGEYCFKAKITSKISLMTEYETIGCATFAKSSKLADELNAIGCAKFESENLHVEACIKVAYYPIKNSFKLENIELISLCSEKYEKSSSGHFRQQTKPLSEGLALQPEGTERRANQKPAQSFLKGNVKCLPYYYID